ncbi:hypothetical protein HPB49_005034 [Dermacentor silvarum]|uniref:Uncharacterized protein n=1 Tax=Dermacentor silvarum TaxID=543639 RepID=A0ACB8D338_DERSI|nr:hypothetical protein HPB49_005034 [Dermacentor silvarum]
MTCYCCHGPRPCLLSRPLPVRGPMQRHMAATMREAHHHTLPRGCVGARFIEPARAPLRESPDPLFPGGHCGAHLEGKPSSAPSSSTTMTAATWQDKPSSPNIFSRKTNNLHGMSDAFSSEEENDYAEVNPAYRLPDRTTVASTQEEAMVVMQCVQLHLGGTGAPQPLLPMGTLVTALYRHRDWICVQTPHGVRGFVRHGSCAPLGTLLAPNTGRRQSSATSRDLTLRRNLAHHGGSHNAARVADKLFLEKNIDVWASDQSMASRLVDAADTSSV